MRRLTALVACGMTCLVLGLRAQQPVPGPQEPFRAGVDVVQVDVSVVDKNHEPVRGLTAADFTVLENGKPQRIVDITPIETPDIDPKLTAWMRLIPRDVAANDMVEIAGDGRLMGILIDDRNIPFDDPDIAISVRDAARHIVDSMGPSDSAAVVFAQDAGRTIDFTGDRQKLYDAIDSYDPHRPPFIGWASRQGQGPIEGDHQVWAPALSRSECVRNEPAVPALETLVARMAAGPARQRKTVMYLGVGVSMNFSPSGCYELFTLMQNVFSLAHHADVVVNTIDPLGYLGYQDYLNNPMRAARGTGRSDSQTRTADPRLAKEFMQITADNTGGHAVIDTDAVTPEIDRIFEEGSSYYLLGYETSNPKPDGKFRRIEVHVNRQNMTVHARAGYWAPTANGQAKSEDAIAFTPMMQGIAGLTAPTMLPLRAVAVPVGRVNQSGSDADVAVILTARIPSPHRAVDETFTLIRNVYDADDHVSPPVREIQKLPLPFVSTEQMRFDVFARLALAPGRYQIRLNGTSATGNASGSVYADVEVPDFARSALTMTPVILGAAPAEGASRGDALASVLPIVPTTARTFTADDRISAFVRVFEGGATPVEPVTLTAQVLDLEDKVVFEDHADLTPDAFGTKRSADHLLALPLDHLERGPHVLSITARFANGRTARQDLVFSIRAGN